ncbi:MAG: hypothetical protein DMD33_20675 [Gemmatimonadetes bacterium]|nr:MAG: hypothetical protein DMD33_20675 [Gemmatimonadota bacterium]
MVPRLLVMTSIWPTPEHPSAGIFVANRLRGLPDVTVVVDRRNPSWPVRLMRFIVDGLRASGPFDGVESHVLYTAGFAALVVARLRGLPLLAYAHGTDARQYAHWGRGYQFFVRQVVRHADLLATNSEDSAQHLRRIGREPQVIPPGYDDELFRPSPRPASGKPRVLYLGGASELKGYNVASQFADTLAGPGILELRPADVAQAMAQHDVVLLPTRAEAFGLVAMPSRLPCNAIPCAAGSRGWQRRGIACWLSVPKVLSAPEPPSPRSQQPAEAEFNVSTLRGSIDAYCRR